MDGCLNVVLENVVLHEVDERQQGKERVFAEAFIRGNNICYIAPTTKLDRPKADQPKSVAQKMVTKELD